MDMQKEREAFEKAFAQTEFYRNKADLYSLLADIDDETFDFFRKNGFDDYSIGEAQAAWSAWQAAKAKAVPDGYKVVPVNYECVWCGCTELGGWTDEAMLEAQEQAHD